jgi:hypothetical protein
MQAQLDANRRSRLVVNWLWLALVVVILLGVAVSFVHSLPSR